MAGVSRTRQSLLHTAFSGFFEQLDAPEALRHDPAASACYGVGEAYRWKTSLERKRAEAIRFYAAIPVATLIGL
jgi:hypothetical protein